MPIDKQIIHIFFQMECYNNKILLDKIATIIEVNYDTINCIYYHIITIIKRTNLCSEYIK